MRWRRAGARAAGLCAVAIVSACASGVTADDDGTIQRALPVEPTVLSTTTSVATTTTTAPATTTVPTAPTDASSTTRPHPARSMVEQAWVPYAMSGPVTLHHPSDRVEAIGFHQSGHDGAQRQTAVPGAARWFVQADRERDTDPQGAADIVVEPDRALRVPVTGTVLRAGTYTLYCDHVDQYAVIEPDARPGWEVKVLHIEGLVLTKGQRVEAGVTPLAARARALPFASNVEDDTAVPAWPHVHIEVVDPSVPDRPTGPGCS